MQVIKEKYGVGSDQLRAYVHYHPSYYHLHVHFMHLCVDAGAGMAAGKAHLLDDVIGRSLCQVAAAFLGCIDQVCCNMCVCLCNGPVQSRLSNKQIRLQVCIELPLCLNCVLHIDTLS